MYNIITIAFTSQDPGKDAHLTVTQAVVGRLAVAWQQANGHSFKCKSAALQVLI